MTHRRSPIPASLFAVLTFTAISLQAQHTRKEADLLVVPAQELPKTSQMSTDSMYLRPAADGSTYLYLEQQAKHRMVILNVTRPSKIRQQAVVALDVNAPFDFVRSLGPDVSLVCFRGAAGSGVISFRKPLQPTVTMLPSLRQAVQIEEAGSTGLIVVSGQGMPPKLTDRTVQVVDLSEPGAPNILATIPDASQQIEDPETGAHYILGEAGLTVVRQPHVEAQRELASKGGN